MWWNRGRACGACRCLDARVCRVWGLGYGERLRPAYEEGVRGSETLRIATRWSLRGSVRSCAWRIYLYLIDLSPAASCYPSAHPGCGDNRPETHPEGENPTSHAHNNAITLTEPTHNGVTPWWHRQFGSDRIQNQKVRHLRPRPRPRPILSDNFLAFPTLGLRGVCYEVVVLVE